eukprot:CAMPEP_0182435502 /NCGR_PEP_ID=MMETSP1167-20130531/76041_1 /TAXON_ID=2988 /ORGANISM="Mallomonas Sp, Strain CCMP3275" /LENGTH=83 /DNA_ID=CAMNT_0024626609 /DNA_START=279 /DNA_END=530 /DNA_ORIENTATION=+
MRSHDSRTAQILKERDDLQNELYIIQAIALRNKAQIDSFVDEKAQWEAQSQQDRDFLLRRPFVESRIDFLEELLLSREKEPEE